LADLQARFGRAKRLIAPTLAASAIITVSIGVALLNRGGPSLAAATAVYYQVIGPRDVTLWVRLLDGATQPRQLAARPLGSWFMVSPDARLALAIEPAGEGRRTVEAIELATGTVGWRTQVSDVMEPIWHGSARLAASVPADPGGILLVDLQSGKARQVGWPAGHWFLFGFTPSGDPVLAGAGGDRPGWSFLVLSWADGQRRMATAEEVRDVEPQTPPARRFGGIRGVVVDLERAGGGEPRLVVRAPDGRRLVDLGQAPNGEWDWAVFDPVRSMVLAADRIDLPDGATEVMIFTWDAEGRRRLLAQDLPGRFDPILSAGGGMLSLSLRLPSARPLIGVLDLRDGRVVILPLPERLVEAAIVQVVDGGSIPTVAIAPWPSADLPVGSASPSRITAIDGPSVLTWRLEDVAGGGARVHATILGPGAHGETVEQAVMPAIDVFEPVDDPTDRVVTFHPRPQSDEVLIWYSDSRISRAWTWTPGERPRAIDLPPDMPAHSRSPIWRQDGGALALQAAIIDGDGFHSVVAVMDYSERAVHVVTPPPEYSDLAGWAPNSADLVMRHQICIEGCPGRYALVATLGLDGTLVPVELGDTSLGTTAMFALQQTDPAGFRLTSIEDELGDDVFISWPGDLPTLDQGYAFAAPDGRDTLVLNGDHRELVLYRIEDPLATAVDGVAAVQPVRLGAIRASLSIAMVHPDLRWALATDGTQFHWLVDLEEGTEIELDVDIQAAWR
jgi:hypothetical protein